MAPSLEQDYEASDVIEEKERPTTSALSTRGWKKFRRSAPTRKSNQIHIRTIDPPAEFGKVKVIAYRDLEARKLGQPEYELGVGVSSVPIFPDKRGFVDLIPHLVQIQGGYSLPEDRHCIGDVFITVIHCAVDELECLMGENTRILCEPHTTIVVPEGVRFSLYNKCVNEDAVICILSRLAHCPSHPMVHSSTSVDGDSNLESSALPHTESCDYVVPLLMTAVVILGAFNNLLGRMRAVPLGEYDFFTAVLNALVYVIVWSSIFLTRRYALRVTPKEQADFVWSVHGKWNLLMFGGLGDAIGGLLGFIGQPYVSGVMYSLMNQAIVRVSGPRSFQPPSSASHSDPFMAALIALSTSGNALSFVLKEKVFRAFVAWQTSAAREPLLADQRYSGYICVNLLYNAALLFLVQRGSALLAFVSLKAVTPASAILFSIDWPVLGPSTVTWLDWVEVVLVTVGIVAFRAGNLRKEEYIRQGQKKICMA
ncbi:hypothetical protein Pmar_PMAR010277 [Perkinsus marinus ATCC 50983]|uniref:Uncharacterized protein n=1 Tax=Perkinsus marinus (strain ATCC 50983 / TXsc) TaxID=423536 RepID=C5K5A9_PERM5|nr:hypothetical protein Pmar_PMAR010277 [Perkinsus marinus ATCC 50983]EER20531.1 hypothetical protein Pmar_PMAR010277 [Perkinsus marinus ATCC 50983]|eukprot:XP_002788735.1 hypothetical protein Pmar_PMAR010277 [Perkinsus marinus ATCC 50983]